MFDIGFWELTIIGVVALLVIGPERLPKVARTAGMWLGRGRRFVASVKSDIDRELAAEELKKTLSKQAQSESLYDIIEETKQSIETPAEAPVKADHSSVEPTTDKQNDANG
jgi:sec-independent protein translocase protein TatB